jgi:L,D-transpeptidase catalytic domain
MTEALFARSTAAMRGRLGLPALATVFVVAVTWAVALPAGWRSDLQPAAAALPPDDEVEPPAPPPAPWLRLADDIVSITPPLTEPTPQALKAWRAEGPEARLIAVYRSIGAGRGGDALAMADALTQDHPNFRLAHLVRGDLLLARTSPLSAFGTGALALPQPKIAALAALHHEAEMRLRGLRDMPPADAVPTEFVRLPPSTSHAIAVDASRSRLYVFENGPGGLKRVGHYYVSIGKRGAEKSVEGDQRTPLGVYFIADRLDPNALEDRFGAAALPLNYPNAHDKASGRTGGGIWLHGVPSNTYARPPLDTDGCVVLTNPDLIALANLLPRRDTPVIISRNLNWVRPAASTQRDPRDAAFLDVVKGWQAARLQQNNAALTGFYAPMKSLVIGDVRREPRPANERVSRIDEDWSVLGWAEAPQVRVVTFRERYGADDNLGRLMRQYWTLADGRWAIRSESVVR